jgi:hypothetical protein
MKIVTAAITATALSLLANPAGADVVGTLSTQLADGCCAASFTTDYTCQTDGTIAFTFTSASFSGTGMLEPSGSGGNMFFFFSGTNDGHRVDYGGTYADSGTWLMATAILDGGVVEDGGAVYAGVTGNFTGIPTCFTDEPATGNHGKYVSGAVKAGVTGKALARLAGGQPPDKAWGGAAERRCRGKVLLSDGEGDDVP